MLYYIYFVLLFNIQMYKTFHSLFIHSHVDGAFVYLRDFTVVERAVLTLLNITLHARVQEFLLDRGGIAGS